MGDHVEVRPGAYADSVSLMLASQAVAAEPGVSFALLAMATPLNLGLLHDAGLSVPGDAAVDDLVVAIRADSPANLTAAVATVEGHLAAQRSAATPGVGDDTPTPRTVGAAARSVGPGAVALISVPGRHAIPEAVDALDAGLHPMLFSDQISLADEVALKRRATAAGLLVMGPDCGTTIIGGVGLGFADVIAPGPVGIVSASGTGAQQLCSLLDDAGIGVSHVLGVGGRDLSDAVGGLSTRTALRMLDADPATELIVVISKPPSPAVAAAVQRVADDAATPVLMAHVGQTDLAAVADAVAGLRGQTRRPALAWPAPGSRQPRTGHLRGLFAGGTLCAEARVIAQATLGPIAEDPEADGHVAVDLGDDRYTDGRAHPMIDQSLRTRLIRREGDRPGSHVLLLDVVLGHAAHPDPAQELASAITDARAAATARGEDLAVVVSLCGTSGDPQGRAGQAARLQAAGASVHAANADAARTAAGLLAGVAG